MRLPIYRHCERLVRRSLGEGGSEAIQKPQEPKDRLLRRLCLLAMTLITTACTSGLPTSERLEIVRNQKQEALAQDLAARNLEYGAPVFIRLFKEEKILETWVQAGEEGRFAPYKSYKICNVSGTIGPKTREGDRQGPEGFYEIGANQMNPWSAHHLSFNIGFPNEYDKAHGYTGSALMIHGGCKSDGCYAMTDEAMEEIYLLTEASIAGGNNVPVHIFPFRMTPDNMTKNDRFIWAPFWNNLKEGNDVFELTQIPPKTRLSANKYIFSNPAQTTFF